MSDEKDFKLSTPIRGIDISYVQEGFNFAAAKNDGIRFVIIRAGFAESTDALLYSHIDNAIKQGLPFGFYWYSYALSTADAISEAAACIKAISAYKPDYPVFFDMENEEQIQLLDNRQRTDIAKTFCNEIKKSGLPCGLYANPSWLQNFYFENELIPSLDLWLAAWTDNPNKPTTYNFGQTIWQWGTQMISGTETDGNVCYIDYPAKTKAFYDSLEDKNKNVFAVGDKVYVKKGALTYDGKPLAPFVYDNVYTVLQAGTNNYPDYIVIGINGEVTAALKSSDLTLYGQAEQNFKKGDLVRVKAGATTYDGKPLASFVYNQIYTVIQSGTANLKDYIVIGQNGNVTAAVKASSLIAVDE